MLPQKPQDQPSGWQILAGASRLSRLGVNQNSAQCLSHGLEGALLLGQDPLAHNSGPPGSYKYETLISREALKKVGLCRSSLGGRQFPVQCQPLPHQKPQTMGSLAPYRPCSGSALTPR